MSLSDRRHEDARESVLRLAAGGMFVGMLDEDEAAVLPELISEGLVRRSYEGAGGLMGLAKISLATPPSKEPQS